jgi:NitT/TauT family transport system permease protein
LASRDRGATLAASQADLAPTAVVANTPTRERIPLGLVGVLLLIAAWWTVTHLLAAPGTLGRSFAPDAALSALIPLVRDDHLLLHVLVSVRRVAIGMAWAVVIGVPVGLLVGRFRSIDRMLTPAFQFLRMISPLSWMPIAVMSLGVGDRSVYFLLAFAAVWPVIMNTAAGVTQLDKRWIQLGQSLAATRVEMLVHIYLPGIAAHVLTGLRLATGILWIVLVPAEMLGVSAGLGYLILDTRDRLDYAELTATIFVIGAIGFAIDALLRALYRRFVR